MKRQKNGGIGIEREPTEQSDKLPDHAAAVLVPAIGVAGVDHDQLRSHRDGSAANSRQRRWHDASPVGHTEKGISSGHCRQLKAESEIDERASEAVGDAG